MSTSIEKLLIDLASGEVSTHQIALAYAKAGIAVFPVKPGEKAPATPNGYKDASTDPEMIRHWFGHPAANSNIGLVPGTGEFLVVDIDVKNGGFESLAKLSLPPTIMVRTGSGGLHLWYRVPQRKLEALKAHGGSSNGKLGKGIDTRFTKGYLVSPPSKTTGTYEWMLPGPMVPAND